MYVKVPADHIDIIENSEAGDNTNKAERTINRLINQLCCSVFYHKDRPLNLNKINNKTYYYVSNCGHRDYRWDQHNQEYITADLCFFRLILRLFQAHEEGQKNNQKYCHSNKIAKAS
jgi:hypothetical protein